jgi:uncharacterized repeat protein (TIGR02543 family)
MWDPIIYSISYVLNGGTNHPSNPLNYVFGESVIFQNPTRDGYEFEGWFSDSSLTQSKNKIESVELGNVTIYAKWAIKLFNINYVLNGGNNSIYNINQYRASDSRIYLLDPVRSGYAFVSWYLDSAFTTSIFNFEPSMVLSDLTVYAKWQLIPTTDPFVPGGILSNTEEANNYFFTVTDSSTSLKQISTIKFIPSVSGVYNLYSTNTTSLDTYGLLYDEFGTLLETDDDDGAGSNFSMTRYLYAGRKYYLRSHLFFTSSTGSWSVFIRFQSSEIFTNLTNVTLNTIYTTSDTSTTSFVYFGLRFVPINSGLYYVETLGILDVEAYTITVDGFYTSFDDDSGEGLNSKIQVYLIAGNVYFIVTNLYTASLTGSYQVVVYPA